jgi:hypothetical protein
MMDLCFQTEDVGEGIRVELHQDEDPMSPRENTNIGHMLCSYRGYDLGDEQAQQPMECEVECPTCGGTGSLDRWRVERYLGYWETVATFDEPEDAEHFAHSRDEAENVRHNVSPAECQRCEGSGQTHVSISEYLRVEYGATVVLPLFVYEHSGITMRAGANVNDLASRGRFMGDDAGWDTSLVGFIFDTPENLAETGCPRDQIEEALRAEVEEYAQYLEGAVCGFVVRDTETDECLDSCWGFYDDADCMSVGKAEARHEVEKRQRTNANNELALKGWRY